VVRKNSVRVGKLLTSQALTRILLWLASGQVCRI